MDRFEAMEDLCAWSGEQLPESIRVSRLAARAKVMQFRRWKSMSACASEPLDARSASLKTALFLIAAVRILASPTRNRRCPTSVRIRWARSASTHRARSLARCCCPRSTTSTGATLKSTCILRVSPESRKHRPDSGRRGLRDPHGHAGRIEPRREAHQPMRVSSRAHRPHISTARRARSIN